MNTCGWCVVLTPGSFVGPRNGFGMDNGGPPMGMGMGGGPVDKAQVTIPKDVSTIAVWYVKAGGERESQSVYNTPDDVFLV